MLTGVNGGCADIVCSEQVADVELENPRGVNQPVHWMGSWGVRRCHTYRKDLEIANLASVGTGNVVRNPVSVVLATVDAEAGRLGLVVIGNVR